MRNFQPNEEVYKAGAASDEMLILLKGQMIVSSASGEPLGSVAAGNPIGEMGVFTGHVRSATVTATTEAGGVAIRKMDVDILMTRNASMYVKVLQNIIGILSDRLAQANTQNEQHMKTIMRMRDQMERLTSKSK
jgi:CRP-like cAMP-binding protein